MVLLAAFMTQVGALQTAPILIAVITAFLTMEGVKYLIANRKLVRRSRREAAGAAGRGDAAQGDASGGRVSEPHNRPDGRLRNERET